MTTIRHAKPPASEQQAPAASQPATAEVASPPLSQLTVVTLPDAIDTTNEGQVHQLLARALADGTAVLVADGSGTAFCGCSGVTALLLTHHMAAAAGAQLLVVARSPTMRRILELTGADHVLDTYPTLADALAGHSGSSVEPLGPVPISERVRFAGGTHFKHGRLLSSARMIERYGHGTRTA